jgi:predicted nucleic acid-binding protein
VAGAVYLDTSVLARGMLDHPETDAIVDALGFFERHVSSRLLEVELRRTARRRGLRDDEPDAWLRGVALSPLDADVLAAAARLDPAQVGTLDAIHLATALRLAADGQIDALFTFDAELAAGARLHGLTVIPPAA